MKNSSDDLWLSRHAPLISRSAASGQPLLELGCGSGRDTVQLHRFGTVVAVDQRMEALLGSRSPSSHWVCADIAQPLPFADNVYCLVVASLCLHYFPLATTHTLIGEIKRVMVDDGPLIVRVNSTRDSHYGAGTGDKIADNFYRIDNATKRFFNRDSIEQLFRGWTVLALSEQEIDRYDKPKVVWEAVLSSG